MKLIIAGGRDEELSTFDLYKIALFCLVHDVSEIVNGGATGVDAQAAGFATNAQIPIKVFHADWEKHGKAAGPIRNAEMAAYADAVVLFPGGKGTESMYQEAKKAGIKIYDWRNG